MVLTAETLTAWARAEEDREAQELGGDDLVPIDELVKHLTRGVVASLTPARLTQVEGPEVATPVSIDTGRRARERGDIEKCGPNVAGECRESFTLSKAQTSRK